MSKFLSKMAEVKCKDCGKIIDNINSKEEIIQCPYCNEIFSVN